MEKVLMNEPSFKTFFINSKHDYKKASLYKKAYKEILSENLFDKDFYIKKYFQKEESKYPGSYQKHIQQYKDSLEKRLSQVGV